MPRSYFRKAQTLYLPTLHPSTADGKARKYPRTERVAQQKSETASGACTCVAFVGVGAASLAEVMSFQPVPHRALESQSSSCTGMSSDTDFFDLCLWAN